MADLFNVGMMTIARRARGLSQTALAQALDISQSKISKIEAGVVVPDSALIEKMAELLSFRPSFFCNDRPIGLPPPNFHRKRAKLGANEWERILAVSEIYRLCIEFLLKSVDLVPSKKAAPRIDPDQFDGDVSRIASAVRQAWVMPRGPVADLTKAIEDSGIVIAPFDFGTELIDAFCQPISGSAPPVIFLNSRLKKKDRIRFSLAHELAHLVMHQLPTSHMEQEANQFAAALLMPEEDIRPSLHGLSIEKLMALKVYWKTSMQSIAMRARDTQRISDRSFKYFMVQMSKRGWRSTEPVEIDGNIENPKLLKRLFFSHLNDLGYNTEQLSQLMGIYADQIPDMIPENKPRLRLVT